MLDDLLRQHDGVITLAQALECGLSHSAISRRVQSGHWRRYAHGVYFVDDRPFSTAALIRAAVWSYGPRAAASGLAAAWWHGILGREPDVVEVTVPRNSNGRKHPRSTVRRRDLQPVDIVEHNGLRVTALALTVVEAAVRRGGGARVMDTGLQRHPELPVLWRAHLRNRGRYGSPRARMLLQGAGEGTRSAAERLFARLMKSAAITGWTANHPIGDYVVDFAFAGSKVAIEIDGLAFHTGPDEFQNDRVRQNRISLLGWTVLRFTWQDLIEDPERVIAEVRRAISA
ncbi:type IV toxin-antitoxin system AbiEi family antitoxin domain-containing protein [Mycolicibacterium komossense]|uniref:Type IV toxin-antitoxin system AbiEi family antitoxin domain-containing protein n=1 Tax=Mycolicibacterium komossense TaxID=1779 RepID=A0ABT3CMG7_9MYCO|nr:type IV toxin-antitoxin system AbiEi family antitoxin domain-containing protein [Mycolicibacterium komossense]MCV7230576.1 type IV toxin-antitoxin system AbiEi family antitoxin domain-containing protein [Mycolicibacterium komossense]